MKRIGIILAAGLAISACGQMPRTSSQQHDLGPKHISVSPYEVRHPSGEIMPGMKGLWTGVLVSKNQNVRRYGAGLYISGSTKTKGMKAEDMNMFRLDRTDCFAVLKFVKNEADGTVIFGKALQPSTNYCNQGFVRAQPLDDGTLRVSEHDLQGREFSSATFTRSKD